MTLNETTVVNQWLAALAAKAGLDGLGLDGQGGVALRYGDDIELLMELPEQSPVLHLYVPVLQLSQGMEQAAIFRQLLARNLFALETQGASFALDEGNERIVLQYPLVVAHSDAALFERVVGNLLEAAVAWKARLRDEQSGVVPQTPVAKEPVLAVEPASFNAFMVRV
ncbi:MAG: CesT family type III secretion system chaperone [Acidovorax sp.]|jgi:hypothetical protein